MKEYFDFFLDGDLNQMRQQREFLDRNGIETRQNNVYPCLRASDVKEALTLIWNNRVPGWWHYEKHYVENNICTKEEFLSRLKG